MEANYDIVIVGSGPSGIATALSLQKLRPDLARRTLVIEKGKHPRHKLCGGGVTFTAKPTLEHIGVPLDSIDIPTVQIDTVRARFEDRVIDVHYKDAFRIVRRNEFDAALVKRARARGIEIREETTAKAIEPVPEGVVITTDSNRIRARVVVGADGAKSFVRRKMALPDPSRVSRLMELLTPEIASETREFTDHTATFDFTPIKDGVQGYYWDFPSYKGGQAFMNRGIFDSRVLAERPRADLKQALDDQLQQRDRNLADHHLEGHPERWFDPRGVYSNPHMILVGDAAGVEPLLGEGIAYALMYGPMAADALIDAFDRDDFSFSTYRKRLLRSPVGKHLRFRTRLARLVYRTPPKVVRAMMTFTKPAAAFIAWQCRGRV